MVIEKKNLSIEKYLNEIKPYLNVMIIDFGKSNSLFSRDQIGLETRMRGNDFIFDCVNLLYYKSHQINFKGGGL